jgi:hypothetical protein
VLFLEHPLPVGADIIRYAHRMISPGGGLSPPVPGDLREVAELGLVPAGR